MIDNLVLSIIKIGLNSINLIKVFLMNFNSNSDLKIIDSNFSNTKCFPYMRVENCGIIFSFYFNYFLRDIKCSSMQFINI